MKRISKIEKSELLKICAEWLEDCQIHAVGISTIKLSHQLVKNYDFQLFDSIIVASALEAGCEILYSEDMQSGQVIEKKLTIINPFV
jgi:predicted nucleic acid-binding protein